MAHTINKKQASKVISQLHLLMTKQHFFVDIKGDLNHRRSTKPVPRKVVYFGIFDKNTPPDDIWQEIRNAITSGKLTYND